MSQDVFECILQLDMKCIKTQLALQCSPLLAGIKISNMLTAREEDVEALLQLLEGTGISVCILYQARGTITLLLYRKDRMESYLYGEEVARLLCQLGYEMNSLEEMFDTFRQNYEKYQKDETKFPHEMGLFLGYPVEDVLGFMIHEGEHYIYCGYWKVYEGLQEKIALFERYEEVRETIIRSLIHGSSIHEVITQFN